MIRIRPNRKQQPEPVKEGTRAKTREPFRLFLDGGLFDFLNAHFAGLFPFYPDPDTAAKKKNEHLRRLIYLAARIDQHAGQPMAIPVLEGLARELGVQYLDSEEWAPEPPVESNLLHVKPSGHIEVNLDDPELRTLALEARQHFSDMIRRPPSARQIMIAMGITPIKALALSTFVRRGLTKRIPLP